MRGNLISTCIQVLEEVEGKVCQGKETELFVMFCIMHQTLHLMCQVSLLMSESSAKQENA